MGPRTIPNQPAPLSSHLLPKDLEQHVQTGRIHPRQQEEGTLTRVRLDRGVEPAPLVAIRHDPGRPHPKWTPAPPKSDLEPEAAFIHRPDPAQTVVPHESAEVGF